MLLIELHSYRFYNYTDYISKYRNNNQSNTKTIICDIFHAQYPTVKPQKALWMN